MMIHDVLLGLDQLLQAANESREIITHAVANVMQGARFSRRSSPRRLMKLTSFRPTRRSTGKI